MAHMQHHSMKFQITPAPAQGTVVQAHYDQNTLMRFGLNIQVAVSPGTVFKKDKTAQYPTINVQAHFDTGASRTCIDDQLAKMLDLAPLGEMETKTANGIRKCSTFCVDLVFPGTEFKPFINLGVTSAILPFEPDSNKAETFGILLGRDIMSKWHISWHGPTSTVFISD